MSEPIITNTNGPQMAVLPSLFGALAVIFLLLRLWARRLKKISLVLNDYLMIVATLFTIGVDIAYLYLYPLWAGPTTVISPEVFAISFSVGFAQEFLWTFANTAVKLSVLNFYLCLFPFRPQRWVIYSIMALTVCYLLMVSLEALLLCRPIAFFWDPTIVGGSCGNIANVFLSASCLNLVLDVMIVTFPMPMFWRLQMRTRKKLALVAIFGIGGFICIVTALRIVCLVKIDPTNPYPGLVPLAIWTTLEPNLGVINACLPFMEPVFERLFGVNPFSIRNSKGSTDNSGHKMRPVGTAKTSSSNEALNDIERCSDEAHPANGIERRSDAAEPANGIGEPRRGITGPDHGQYYVLGDGEQVSVPNSGIAVRSDWNVQHT